MDKAPLRKRPESRGEATAEHYGADRDDLAGYERVAELSNQDGHVVRSG
jgi:hypothetical protein